MRRVFIPLLLLASVAITSTTTLPLMSASKPEASSDDDGQQTDNIISNSNSLRGILNNIIYNIPDDTNKNESPEKTPRYGKKYKDRSELSLDDFISQENAYNDEGFRKEQWHNYPRRLDRLQEYILSSKNRINQIADQYNNDNIVDLNKNSHLFERRDKDIKTNEFELDSKEDANNFNDNKFSVTSPILTLKLQLAYLKNQYKNVELQNYEANLLSDLEKDNSDLELFNNEMNPVVKVKCDDVTLESSSCIDEDQTEKKTVSKRLFSLWSRLQSLSHKGHEPPHRRHLAFYSMPEGGAGADAALNTQTRALMRPPGSPLRWG